MTYRLYDADLATNRREPQSPQPLPGADELRPLLAPEKLIPASEILRDRTLIPDVAGIYGWWFDIPLPGVPLEVTLSVGKHHLLYVGIAPRKPSAAGSVSKGTLRKRITRNHLGNRIGSSTLRRSLAGLLSEELQLVPVEKGTRHIIPSEKESSLTGLMAEHAALSFLPHAAAWEVEDKLVASDSLVLPLNLRGANHLFVPTLRGIRRAGHDL